MPSPQNLLSRIAIAILALWISGCASTPARTQPTDPIEGFNRGVFKMNTGLDKYLIKPVANGYTTITPSFVRTGVSNFFDNVGYLNTVINDLLQGKIKQGFRDTGRFVFNSTFGIAGLIDIATPMGMPENDEDLGQTFAVWGMGSGPYGMLPVLGPTTARDLPGRAMGIATELTFYLVKSSIALPLTALQIIDKRARLGDYDKALEQTLDPYTFTRDAYAQRRDYLVFDGQPPVPDILDDIDNLDDPDAVEP